MDTTQNPRLVWVGRVLKAHPMGRVIFHYPRFLSNLALATFAAEKVENVTSHPEELLEGFSSSWDAGEGASRDFGREAPHICRPSTLCSFLTFSLSQCPLQAEKWLRKEEPAGFLAAGLERICLVAVGAVGELPKVSFIPARV